MQFTLARDQTSLRRSRSDAGCFAAEKKKTKQKTKQKKTKTKTKNQEQKQKQTNKQTGGLKTVLQNV